ncbi:MAG: pyridoxal-dependent decarboxylase [Polyangiaceae bacterium]
MQRRDFRSPLSLAHARALAFLEGLPDRPIRPSESGHAILARIDRPVPPEPRDAREVVAELVDIADPGVTAMPSGRFFGWVIGGGLPAAVAADWLATAWDQNTGSYEGTPAAAMFEQVAIRWVIELLELPPSASGALTTGAQMANTVGLAAARNAAYAAIGHDVEARGLAGAPRVHVLVGEERHDTVMRSLRLLGLGSDTAIAIGSDANGRMRADRLAESLAQIDGPAVVCAQAGNVNTGGVDPMDPIADAIAARRARGAFTWLHVDGAFGLWARASADEALRARVRGVDRADSWATDGHKWPNVPYDCGVAIVRDRAAHERAMAIHASYLPGSDDARLRNPFDWTPELSRRARGFALYAALSELGRSGMAALVDRTCAYARRFAEELARVPGVSILNEIDLNQVLVRFESGVGGDGDAHTRAVVRAIQEDGTCYATGTTWRGRAALRISVCNASTDDEDVRRSIAAITRAHTG